MENISVETAQNVDIEYKLASIGDRIVAFLIDLLIIVGYIILTTLMLSIFEDLFDSFGLNYGVAISVIIILPVFFYDFICETFLGGQSFGKKLKKIKVVKIDGTKPGVLSYFLRWILRPIDIYFTYGSVAMITIFLNGKGQRLGDIAAKTSVIKLKQDVTLADTIYTRTKKDYEPTYPEVIKLNDEDIRTVKEVILLSTKNVDPLNYNQLLVKTKNAVSTKMETTTTQNPLYFLNRVLKDYNHLTAND